MWDGEYLAVGSQDSDVIYRFAVSGSKATEMGPVKLDGGYGTGGFGVQTVDGVQNLYALTSSGIGVYPYPKGGKPSKTLYAVLEPLGLTVSLPAR